MTESSSTPDASRTTTGPLTAESATATELVEILRESQRLGFIGARPVDEAIEHSRAFVTALRQLPAASVVLDLGAGGGLPGLVISHDRPDLVMKLLDRRTKRTDFLARMIRRLGWDDRVSVLPMDAAGVFDVLPEGVDAVVARGFGPPAETLAAAARVVVAGGMIVISEPPSGDRWDAEVVTTLGLRRLAAPPHVAVFERTR